jgi:KUP system potassium uptake protein
VPDPGAHGPASEGVRPTGGGGAGAAAVTGAVAGAVPAAGAGGVAGREASSERSPEASGRSAEFRAHGSSSAHGKELVALVVGALGVVYGDIATSPLYAIKQCFFGAARVPVDEPNVLGILSLIVWSLVLVVSIKYLAIVMRADNRGEGGILSLMSLARPEAGVAGPAGARRRKSRGRLVVLGLFGAALLYGDGMITPAISVLSAVEGLEVVTPTFEPYVVPITVGVLLALFMVQKRGTAGVGAVFGPVTCVWLLALAALGVRGILMEPSVLRAVNPLYAAEFFIRNGSTGFFVLGAVFLVVTGGEALYADMGHFGKRPIQIAWFVLVFPALILNYFGQGALVLRDGAAAHNPFYLLAPEWAIYPLVVLATSAAIIASQAMITGAYSLTRQAMQLGYCPRLSIEQTSEQRIGQVYMPSINWMLCICTLGLVLGFREADNLAAAYGIAVTTTMVITTILFYVVARDRWGWPLWLAGLVTLTFLAMDGAFFAANAVKIAAGGWFPLAVALVVYTLMANWKRGRRILSEKVRTSDLPIETFLRDIGSYSPVRVPGTAVFMTRDVHGTPLSLLHNIKHNHVLHKRVVILTITVEEVPHVPRKECVTVEALGYGCWRIVARYGFMQDPNVPEILDLAGEQGLEFQLTRTTFFLSRETLVPRNIDALNFWSFWREKLFTTMSRNSQSATAFYRIPPDRVVEMGTQVEL